MLVSGISYHIADELVRFDSQLFLDDNGSNTDIVNDENLLVEVHPVDAFVNGVGSAKVTGIGVFIGKSINRDGSEVPIARKRVLVCPSFGRNIIGTSVLQRRDDVVFNRQCKDPHMLAIVGDDEDEVLQYDLHDNPADKDDPFLYFQLVPLDEDEMTEEHEEFIEEASKNNLKEVRALQSHGTLQSPTWREVFDAKEVAAVDSVCVGCIARSGHQCLPCKVSPIRS